ncbi:unnamed protein product [marine sediment metagenome]|uniref:Uncharacterized protein n=1 Tax=marine sediment metagenome TaxID=412755 RepID=X0VBX7_9ZZZZ
MKKIFEIEFDARKKPEIDDKAIMVALAFSFSLNTKVKEIRHLSECNGCDHNLGPTVSCGLPSLTPCPK